VDEAKNIQQAVDNYRNLSKENIEALRTINARIQDYVGEWGKLHDNERTESGVLIMPWVEQLPLIQDFVSFMYDNKLVIPFDWPHWQKGRNWYALDDDSKYEKLDIQTALMLLTAVIRNDRFSDGALVNTFESGAFPKIIQKLTTI
tara:strand:+ start:3080 stop:3517 length:438 start_codon:yes stop_codon:yes gene_type:complete